MNKIDSYRTVPSSSGNTLKGLSVCFIAINIFLFFFNHQHYWLSNPSYSLALKENLIQDHILAYSLAIPSEHPVSVQNGITYIMTLIHYIFKKI